MTQPADWERLRTLFEGALAVPPQDRAAFIHDHVNGDDALRSEIESLVAAHEAAERFLVEPALGRLPEGVLDAAIDAAPPVHVSRLSAGHRLGVFEIVEPIGAGGMGEVYRARDTRLDRFVAIKVLSPDLDVAPRGRERFEREARAISRLSHPRICTVHDIGVAEIDGRDVPYLVMELLDGGTLATRLARGALPLDEALTTAIDIADALVAAHGQGIVHRDLKPANVMVTSTGVKLLDFGLAQLQSPDAGEGPALSLSKGPPAAAAPLLTSAGLVFGTVPYMSPEQLRGEKVDARSDVFSFGALMHEMLTGVRPFVADSQAALIASILEHEPSPVSALQPLAAANLDRIVRKCLAKHPDDRWQTVRDLKSELVWVRDGHDTSVRGRPSRVRRRWVGAGVIAVTTVAALVLTTLVKWGTFALPERPPARTPTHLSLNLPPGITLSIPINTTPFAIAPDGSRLAYIGANQQGVTSLFIHSLDSGKTAPVPETRGAFNPMFSADSQWVAFRQGDIKQVPAGGGPVELVGTPGGGGAMTWLSDGRFVRGNASGQPLRQVVSDERELTRLLDGEEGHLTPLLVGEGALLFSSMRGGMLSNLNAISALWPNASDAIEVVPNATSPQLVGRDALAFARGRSLYAAGFDSQAIRLTGEPRAMGIDVQTTSYQAAPMYTVARNGTLVYAQPPGGRSLVWVDRNNREESVNAPERMYSHFRLSPDGTRVAAYSLDGDRDLWVIGLDGSSAVKVTSGAARDTMPVWSPDGHTIYFTTAERNINRVPADGSTAAQPIFSQPPPDRLHATSITRDGKRLLTHWDLTPVTPDKIELRLLELGPTPQLLTTLVAESGIQSDGQLSHDGRLLVYSAVETLGGDRRTMVRPFPETKARKWPVSPEVGYLPIWSHDDREIFYRTEDGSVMSVPVERGPGPLDLKVGKPVRIVTPVNTIRDYSSGPNYAVSLDGRSFLFIKAPEFDIRSLEVVLNWDVEVKATLEGKGR